MEAQLKEGFFIKLLTVVLISTVILGCSTPKVVQNVRCPDIYRNGFSEISSTEYHTIYKQDTISFNQIRFECVHSALYTQKVIYDKFGRWDREIYPANKKHPILVWENIDLLSNREKYQVMAEGLEEFGNIYASVMVFDREGKDILKGYSTEKVKIAGLFADLIIKNDEQQKGFFEVYWKMVDPKHWATIKKYQ